MHLRRRFSEGVVAMFWLFTVESVAALLPLMGAVGHPWRSWKAASTGRSQAESCELESAWILPCAGMEDVA